MRNTVVCLRGCECVWRVRIHTHMCIYISRKCTKSERGNLRGRKGSPNATPYFKRLNGCRTTMLSFSARVTATSICVCVCFFLISRHVIFYELRPRRLSRRPQIRLTYKKEKKENKKYK